MKIAEELDLNAVLLSPAALGLRVVAFAPHPDDEVFGCGGTLALLASAGAQISVVIVSDGALGGNGADLVQRREAESLAAARLLGYPPPGFWRLPDRGLAYGEPLVARMLAVLRQAGADLVLAPAPTEIHPDHQVVALAAAEALRRLDQGARLALYEVSAPLLPNVMVDISAVEQRKREAMRCFSSQLREQPYDEHIAALNRYRAYHLGPAVRAAEALLLLTAAELASGFAPIFESPLARRHRLGFAAETADLPLVSIIVRSMDRDSLGAALDSLAAQTYCNIEAVVVNAKGGRHRPLGEFCGRFPLRLVNGDGSPLQRSQAANAGLDAAQGSYLGFLDDDDSLDPDHLSHLVDAAQRESGPVVVYAGVRCMDMRSGTATVSRVFGEAMESKAKLLAGNFIPIHAPLFPRSVLAQARFDERLLAYEDWDFWLQLAELARFVYVDRVSATYFTGGSSGVSPQEPDMEAVRRAKLALFGKWKDRISADELRVLCDLYLQANAELGASQQYASRVARQLQEQTQVAQAAELALREAQRAAALASEAAASRAAQPEPDPLQQRLKEAEQRLQEVLNSSSWKLTAPLRALKNAVRRFLGEARQ